MPSRPPGQLLALGISSLAIACAPPPREPVVVAIPAAAALAPSAPAVAPPAPPAAPAGYVAMAVGRPFEDEDTGEPHQAVFIEGDHGSTPFYVPREAAAFVRAFRRGQVSAEQRAPYDDWARRTLADGGAFVRGELGVHGDTMSIRLVVQRAGREEIVSAGDRAVPVILLKRIPLFVEVKLLKEVGGWVEHPAAR